MQEIFLLTFVIGLATLLAILVKRLGLPILVSYVAAGAVLSTFHIVKPEQLKFLSFLPEIGLALLLFLVGMELDLREFKSLGKRVIIATGIQVVFTTIVITLILQLLGLGLVSAVVMGIAVSFSSTILVVKLLLEKKELNSLHGKLAVGVLLIEDLIAVIALMVMPLIVKSGGGWSPVDGVVLIAKGALLLVVALFLGHRVLPKLFRITADNTELLFLTAISWCLIFVSLAVGFGFSLAIGAFLAGVGLAQSVYRVQISGKIKPLRDFFIMLFFLDLGTGLSISGVQSYFLIAILFLVYSVIVKPTIFFIVLTVNKFKIHPAFQTGIVLSSISEFSLILLAEAARLGIVSSELLSPLIFAAVFSFITSSVVTTHSRKLYGLTRSFLKLFEWQKSQKINEGGKNNLLDGHAVLIGCHRSGEIVLGKLVALFKGNVVIVDFNPEIVEKLTAQGYNAIYGDALDPEVYETLNLARAKLIVSTIRELPENLALLELITISGSKAVVVITASDKEEAVKLYEKGAHHVSLPTNLEGISINHILPNEIGDLNLLKKEKEKKMDELIASH